jgi:hypothetical protein
MPPTVIEILPGGIAEEHYAAIGKVASNWAVLERLIDSAIWGLSGADDEEGACLTAQLGSIGRRLDAFNSLIRLRKGSDELMSQINTFTRKANEAARRRNRIIHDPWVAERHTLVPHRFQITADPVPVFRYKVMPTDEVIAVVEEIADLINEFDRLVREVVIRELGSLRKTPPEPSSPAPLDNQT